MAIKDTEEADLGPLCRDVRLALGLQDVEYDRDTVLIVVSDDPLICVCSVRFNHSTLFLRRLRGLVILQEERFRVQHRRVLSKEEGLYLNELDVPVL